MFSTRLGRVADQVDAAALSLEKATSAEAYRLSRRLSYLRRRSSILDVAVALASIGGVMTGLAVLTLFLGTLRDEATTSILFACFGAALICTVAAISAFLFEIMLAGRGIRIEVDRQQDQASTARGVRSL